MPVVSDTSGLDVASVDLLGELTFADRAWLERLEHAYYEQHGNSLWLVPGPDRCRRRRDHAISPMISPLRCLRDAGHAGECVF